MCNPATVTVQTTEETYDAYCKAFEVYDQSKVEQIILDHIFDGAFWNACQHYISELNIDDDAKNVLFEILRKQTVICVSAPDLT